MEETDTAAESAVVDKQQVQDAVRAGSITTLSPSTTASSSSDDDEEEDEDVAESEEEDETIDQVLLLPVDKVMTIAEPATLDRQLSSASTVSVARSMDRPCRQHRDQRACHRRGRLFHFR